MPDLRAAVVTRTNLRDQLVEMWPGLADDEEALVDTLAGIDDFEEQVAAVLRYALEREAHGKAIGDMADTLTARKRRLEDGAKSLRDAVLQAMQEAGLRKIAMPDMTISVGNGKPKVQIVEPELIPAALCRITREPNRTEIAKLLAEGTDIPGATLGNSQSFLTVHRK